MSATFVVSVVYHLDVVDGVGYEVAKRLVIGFGCKLKWTVVQLEAIVESRDEMY